MRNDYTDYIRHGSSSNHKYVAKVNNYGGVARYFYDQAEYQAYLKNKKASNSVLANAKSAVSKNLNKLRTATKKVGSSLKKSNNYNIGIHNPPDDGGIDHLAYNVKKKVTKATNTVKNSKAGLLSRDAASSMANTAKKEWEKTFGHGEKNNRMSRIERASMKAKNLTGKIKDDVTPKAKKAWSDAGVKYKKIEKEIKTNVAPKLKSEARALIKKARAAIDDRTGMSLKTYHKIDSAYDDVLSRVRNSNMDEVDKALIEQQIRRARNDLERAAKAAKRRGESK